MRRIKGISDGIFRDAWLAGEQPAPRRWDYRYTLVRVWGPGPLVLWILANPSTADAEEDDQTVTKGMGFSRRWGFGGMVFANVGAWRATKPENFLAAQHDGLDVVGPANDDVLKYLAFNLRFVVCAWGDCLGRWCEDVRRPQVMGLLRSAPGVELKCLGRTSRFNPKHPLMLSYHTKLESYS